MLDQIELPTEAYARLMRVIQRLFPHETPQVVPLTGGMTNWNVRVTASSGSYAVRLFGDSATTIGIDREDELSALRSAATAGIGPDLVAIVKEHAALITTFVVGRVMDREFVRKSETITRIGRQLRVLHDCPAMTGTVDPVSSARAWARMAAERGVELDERYWWADEVVSRIEAIRGPWTPVPCHTDLREGNLIDDGAIRIVDWEYAGMGDPIHDLANLSVNYEFGTDQERELLGAYDHTMTDDDTRALVRVYRFVSAFREAIWAVLQHAISTIEADYLEYAESYFGRMERMAGESSFAAALAHLEERRR